MDLGKQIGPLPLGAWVAVVGGGLGLAFYAYKTQNTTPTIVDDTSGQPGVGDGSVSSWVPTSPPTTAPGGDLQGAATTNEQWAVRAINWLIAQGYDATLSDSAIRKYIAGNDPAPSIMERTLQGLALAHFGSPPQPLPPPLTEPDPIPHPIPDPKPEPKPDPTPPPPPPANVRWFVVTSWPRKGSSLWTIAEIFYGNGADWPRIYNANRTGVTRPDGSKGMISNPNLIYAGWRLHIP